MIHIQFSQLEQAVGKVFVRGVGKEHGSTKQSVDGIQVAMHVAKGAAKIVLREGCTIAFPLGAVKMGGNQRKGVGRESDAALVVGLRFEQGVERSFLAAKHRGVDAVEHQSGSAAVRLHHLLGSLQLLPHRGLSAGKEKDDRQKTENGGQRTEDRRRKTEEKI
ncbi:MAG: hypothetical protein J5698_00220 [Bacteroidaceae bacterium]|nr:hypothetical protein [Bacteroidaceae bacterium]